MKNLLKKITFLSIFILIFTGCFSSKHIVRVNSYSNNSNYGKKYYLQFEDSKTNEISDFEKEEFKRYVDLILSKNGYIKTNNIKSANQLIIFSYGRSKPKIYTQEITEPQYQNIQYPYVEYKKTDDKYLTNIRWEEKKELVGYSRKTKTYTTYVKEITITSYDNSKTLKLWTVKGSITDQYTELRYYLPFLLKAISNYIGTSSGEAINIEIPYDSKDVKIMRESIIL